MMLSLCAGQVDKTNRPLSSLEPLSGKQRHGADLGPSFCLETSKSMVKEESLVVWQTFLQHLAHWRAILPAKGCLSAMNRMTIHLITPVLAKYNKKGKAPQKYGKKGKAPQKEHVTNLLMVELLKAMEAAGHNETILKVKKKFKVLMEGGEGSVTPDELEQVFGHPGYARKPTNTGLSYWSEGGWQQGMGLVLEEVNYSSQDKTVQ